MNTYCIIPVAICSYYIVIVTDCFNSFMMVFNTSVALMLVSIVCRHVLFSTITWLSYRLITVPGSNCPILWPCIWTCRLPQRRIFLEPLLPTGLRLRLARHFKDSWPFLVVAPAPLCRLWQAGRPDAHFMIHEYSWQRTTLEKTIGNDHHLFIIPSHSNGSRKEHALVWLKEYLKPSDIAVVRSGKVRQIPPRRWEVHRSCQCHRQEEVPEAKMVVVSYNLITDPWMQPEETCQNELNVPL